MAINGKERDKKECESVMTFQNQNIWNECKMSVK